METKEEVAACTSLPPSRFKILNGSLDSCARNSFATLITQDESGAPFASHVPLLFDPEPAPGMLLGHLARANAQWRHFENQRPVLAIFHGPHAYISPRWYASGPAVPTWNYAVVHAYGTPKIMAEASLETLVRRMNRFYEPKGDDAAQTDLPADFLARQLKAIVGFEIRLTRLEGKFKLGQNRPRPTSRASMLRSANRHKPEIGSWRSS